MKYRAVAAAVLMAGIFGLPQARAHSYVAPGVAKILEAYARSGEGADRPLDVIVRAKVHSIDKSLTQVLATGELDLIGLRRIEARKNLGTIKEFIAAYKPAAGAFTLADDSIKTSDLWIVNAMSVRGPVDLIQQLAARPDVEGIYFNAHLNFLPVEAVTTASSSRRRPHHHPTTPADPGADPNPAPSHPQDPGSDPSNGSDGNASIPRNSWGITQIGADKVQAAGIDGSGVVVGQIDTGVDGNHPTLKGKILAFKDFVGSQTDPYDDNGHGTHTAGTIAGSKVQIGVAPGAKLVVAKAMNKDGGGDLKTILSAMQWMLDPSPAQRPSVCSNSWGVDRAQLGDSETLFWDAVQAWRDGGILPVFASGNSGPNTESVPGGYPIAFAIGATDKNNQAADFSTGGETTWNGQTYIKPDVAAPGVDIVSAYPDSKLAQMSGTSMACPHVAGLAALVKQANPSLTVDALQKIITDTATDLGDPGKDTRFGAGLVNAEKAVAAAKAAAASRVATVVH